MIRQIYSDYNLPVNPKELTLDDIRFWYDPLIPGLIRMQNQAKGRKQ